MRRITQLLLWILLIGLFFCPLAKTGLLDAFKPEYRNFIYNHCADWGPNEDGTDEKIYFVKQIIFEEDKKRFGNAVYFCSMNPDGSDKKEIKKIWENTKSFIDMNGNTSFMDICYKTKQAAIAFSAGHKDQTGIWVINLDGSGFKRIVEMEWRKDFQVRTNHPSWFPDGKHLVYQEKWLHKSWRSCIIKINKDGKDKTYLSTETDGENRYPVVSPEGKKIAYTHFWFNWKAKKGQKKGGRDLWIMNPDGKDKKVLYEERHYTDYPEWSPDGKKIYFVYRSNFTLIDALSGKELISKLIKINGRALIPRKVHWSEKYGFLLDGAGSIGLIKTDLNTYVHLKTSGGYRKTSQKRDLSKFEYRWR